MHALQGCALMLTAAGVVCRRAMLSMDMQLTAVHVSRLDWDVCPEPRCSRQPPAEV